MSREVLMIPEETSFMIEAYVKSPGWVSVILRGYKIETMPSEGFHHI